MPSTFVCTASTACVSRIGTCLCAAAWNTTSGRCLANTSRRRAGSRMSARTGVGLAERGDGLEQEALVAVEQDQPGRAVAEHLTGDLTPDRAAGAGDEDDRAPDVVADVGRVDRRVLAAEEVGQVELAQVLQQDVAERVGAFREDLDLRVGLQRAFDDVAQLFAGRCRGARSAAVDRARRCTLVRGRASLPRTAIPRSDRPIDWGSSSKNPTTAESPSGRPFSSSASATPASPAPTIAVRVPLGPPTRCRSSANSRAWNRMPPQPIEYQERGDRRRAEQGKRVVAQYRDPGEPEGRRDRAERAGDEDAQRLVDRRVPPDRSVQPDQLVDDELHDDGNQEIGERTADPERDPAFEPGEKRDQPRERDDTRRRARAGSSYRGPARRRRRCGRSPDAARVLAGLFGAWRIDPTAMPQPSPLPGSKRNPFPRTESISPPAKSWRTAPSNVNPVATPSAH